MLVRREDDTEADVQLTSFMDIAFLLLIFFIVTASLRKPHKELQIELPDAGAARIAKAQKEEMVIAIDQYGHYWVNGKEKNWDGLNEEVRMRQGKNVHIRIDAHRSVSIEAAVKVTNLCSVYNMNKVGFKVKN